MKPLSKLLSGCVLGLGLMGASMAAENKEPIKVGSILSVTGAAAYLGTPELNTLQMYVDDLNKSGGVLGRPLQLIHYDDASDASKANGFAKRLIEDDKVDFIVGGTTTGSTMSMVPLVEKAGVPFMSLAGAVVVVEPVKKWVFKASTTDRIAAERVFIDMRKRGISKIALLSETSGFGQSGKKQSEEVAGKYGITFVIKETYGPKDTDMSPQLTKIKNNKDVQAVFVFGFGQGPAIVTKNCRQLGLDLPLYHAHGIGSEEFINLAGPAAEGAYALAPALMIGDTLAADDPQKAVVAGYAKAYRERFKEDVSMFGGQAYDNFFIVIEAIKRVGGTDKAKVRDAIESTKGFIGTGGEINMTPDDHMGLSVDSLRMLVVKNGKWVEAK
ncbi:ABC transporter substrate-binding protein [Parapusillimonas granuli]|uniref:ABC transporter substrate-binding protein n=1 Tax=Parapusillimonas granuli TaxID=380911 RepID=A0A853G2L3_9BURK|nr:ABC transporter substrate-binding protein [Parapusillimonas granuli]MBB5214591.1 branched-chain amino acid transport system substrate-binding protein [Parapusillimonas granuli]NYT49001.1 ABC transporter substrate-binding protein [Parapusillimonas granuli]